jgi:hypothetical protein
LHGLALATYRVDRVVATEVSGYRRRVCVVTYGDPPRPFATESFVGAVTRAASEVDTLSPESLITSASLDDETAPTPGQSGSRLGTISHPSARPL